MTHQNPPGIMVSSVCARSVSMPLGRNVHQVSQLRLLDLSRPTLNRA